MRKAWFLTLIVVLSGRLFAGPCMAWAQGSEKAAPTPTNNLEKTASDVIAATTRYRAALERVLAIYERDLARRRELAEVRQDLYERGVLSRHEFEESSKLLAEAQKNVEETRRALAETDRMLLEAHIAQALARLTPLPSGRYEETAGLVRFNGPAIWSLAEGTARLQQFFLATFGRALPISAYGQTGLHDRLGFDHRNAVDLAVHPDSHEGRTLMEYLRNLGVPFIAARGAIPGAASGAHIHVGQPSPRMSSRR